MNVQDRERWQQCQRTAQGLAEDMDAVLSIIDRLEALNFDDAKEQCLVVQRTNPPGSPEYALALEARDWLATLKYLREQTTVAQMLTNKLQFIMTLRRQQLAAAFPDADPNDIEVELALDMNGL
jgi:hypothetical protein